MGQNVEAAQAIAASVAQMDLAVREVRPAVEQLGELIGSMSAGLIAVAQRATADFRSGSHCGISGRV